MGTYLSVPQSTAILDRAEGLVWLQFANNPGIYPVFSDDPVQLYQWRPSYKLKEEWTWVVLILQTSQFTPPAWILSDTYVQTKTNFTPQKARTEDGEDQKEDSAVGDRDQLTWVISVAICSSDDDEFSREGIPLLPPSSMLFTCSEQGAENYLSIYISISWIHLIFQLLYTQLGIFILFYAQVIEGHYLVHVGKVVLSTDWYPYLSWSLHLRHLIGGWLTPARFLSARVIFLSPRNILACFFFFSASKMPMHCSRWRKF